MWLVTASIKAEGTNAASVQYSRFFPVGFWSALDLLSGVADLFHAKLSRNDQQRNKHSVHGKP